MSLLLVSMPKKDGNTPTHSRILMTSGSLNPRPNLNVFLVAAVLWQSGSVAVAGVAAAATAPRALDPILRRLGCVAGDGSV